MHLRYKKFDSVESRGRNDSSFSTDNLLRVVPRLIRRMRVISHLHVNISRNVVGLLSHTVIVYFFLLFFFFSFFSKILNTRAMIQAISICAWMWPLEETFPWKQLLVLLHVSLYLVTKDTPCFYTYLLVFLCDASKVDSRGFFFSPGLFLDSFLFENGWSCLLVELLSEHFKLLTVV